MSDILRHEIPYWEKVCTTTSSGKYITAIEKRVVLQANDIAVKPTTALDIGCEGGRWSKFLFDLGWNMTCTDIDQKALELCKTRIPEASCVLVSPHDSTLHVDAESMGFVLCMQVDHVIQSEWFISEVSRVLNRGGLLVGILGNLLSFRGLYGFVNSKIKSDFNYYQSFYPMWKKKLFKEGLNVIHEEGYCWFPFKRKSNSPLVPLFARIERSLALHARVAFSPTIILIAQKA